MDKKKEIILLGKESSMKPVVMTRNIYSCMYHGVCLPANSSTKIFLQFWMKSLYVPLEKIQVFLPNRFCKLFNLHDDERTWLGNPFGIPRNSAINPILDFLNSGIFIKSLFFPIIKCVPANSEHIFSSLESSPIINSSDFINQKTFPPWHNFAPNLHLLTLIAHFP
jgi:hypothetical protein